MVSKIKGLMMLRDDVLMSSLMQSNEETQYELSILTPLF